MNPGRRSASSLPRPRIGEAYLRSRTRAAVERSAALVACIALVPILALVGLLVGAIDGRPVLFRQERIGRFGKPFTLVKFRTMRSPSDVDSELIDAETRVSRLGTVLRRTSLDELPTLVNVVRGEMSLVGPRPLLAVHTNLYVDSHPERLLARPGLTGLAQVSGRRELTFRERFDLDVSYVTNASWSLDIKILLWTLRTLVRSFSRPTTGGMARVDDIGLAEAIHKSTRADHWEHGSVLQPHGPVGRERNGRPATAPITEDDLSPLRQAYVLFGTCRQAMVAIIGAAPRVHIPSYYCPDVVEHLQETIEGEVVRYDDHPLSSTSSVQVAENDVVVLLPHFGRPTQVSVHGGRLLIDATHSLGLGTASLSDAAGRTADICVASLRKTLPVPDGAVVWSPCGSPLPAQPPFSDTHVNAARELDRALTAKAAMLRGEQTDRADIVSSIFGATTRLERGTVPSSALERTARALQSFDFEARWAARERNRRVAVERLELLGLVGRGAPLQLLDAPFMLILIAATPAEREQLRLGLIARHVFPALLWRQDHSAHGSPERDFGDRMLALHVDARYSPADMVRVTDEVNAVIRGERGEVGEPKGEGDG